MPERAEEHFKQQKNHLKKGGYLPPNKVNAIFNANLWNYLLIYDIYFKKNSKKTAIQQCLRIYKNNKVIPTQLLHNFALVLFNTLKPL